MKAPRESQIPKMFYDDDLADFFDPEDFAERLTLDGEIVTAIFSFENVISEEGNRGQVFSRDPSLTLPTYQVENIAVDQEVVRENGKKYRVRNFFHNASGVTEVSLYEDYQ